MVEQEQESEQMNRFKQQEYYKMLENGDIYEEDENEDNLGNDSDD